LLLNKELQQRLLIVKNAEMLRKLSVKKLTFWKAKLRLVQLAIGKISDVASSNIFIDW